MGRRKILTLIGLGLAAAATTALGVGLASASQKEHPISVPDAITDLAMQFAAANGDEAPAELSVVAGTRGDAVAATMGAKVDSNQPVYVVALKGHFIAYSAPRPPKTDPPEGRFMELVLDAETYENSRLGRSRRTLPI
jgi:hypothetical protein